MSEEYLLTFHKVDLKEILEDDNVLKHFSININFLVLYENQPQLGLELLKGDPDQCLEEWNSVALRAQMTLLKQVNAKCELKINVHCRVCQLPGNVNRKIFPDDPKDVGKFLQVTGTVMRITAAKLLEYERIFVCTKCKLPITAKADYNLKYVIEKPEECSNTNGCSGKTFFQVDGEKKCKDYQEIKIQERVKVLGVGALPNTMLVTLEDDLVETCKPGDNVTICGTVKLRWGSLIVGRKIELDIVLKANYLQVDNIGTSLAVTTPEVKQMFESFWEHYSENPLLGRDIILASFCPQLYGLYLVKLAVAIVLAGGCSPEDTTSTGVRTRPESHLLLVGDPGTGKSQLLKFASKIIPRSVLTTGVGSTSAGLTVSALLEHGEWHLEGGALVMADGGICCIDEFNSMKEHDRTSIHEAMEQQTISVAKASMVCKLNTRCSILAACNPKGNIDPSQPLCMSVALPSPLLSRFDLVLMLRDVVNDRWDNLVADYILNGGGNFSKLTSSNLWTLDNLQMYFLRIRKFQPKLTEDAEQVLSSYYQMQRRILSRNKARTTIRLLESLIRLSQGHARLMYRETVEVIDSIYAVILIDAAMESDSSILNSNINTNSSLPEKPLSDYREKLKLILEKLNLQEILDVEMAKLDQFKENGKRSRFFQKTEEEKSNKHETLVEKDKKNKFAHGEGYMNEFRSKLNLFNVENNPEEPTVSSILIESNDNETIQELNKVHEVCNNTEDSFMEQPSMSSSNSHVPNMSDLNKGISVIENDTTKIRSDNTNTKNNFEGGSNKLEISLKERSSSSNDEGYDTVSMNTEDSFLHNNVETNSCVNAKCVVLQNVVLNQNSNKIIPYIGKTNIPVMNTPTKNLTLMDRFKYRPRAEDVINEPKENIVESKQSTSTNIKCGAKSSGGNSVENDLELLKLMPSITDLQFNWDNFKPESCHSSTMISNPTSQEAESRMPGEWLPAEYRRGILSQSKNSMFEGDEDVDFDI